MRHFLGQAGAIVGLAAGMIAGAGRRGLIAGAGRPEGGAPGLRRTFGAVQVATVAPGAEMDLRTAALAEEPPA